MRLQAVVLIFMVSLAGSSFAQTRLPFTGTRTFCSIESDKDSKWRKAIVSIDKDGSTTVKTNMWVDDDANHYVTFSGKLDAEGELQRKPNYSLLVKSGQEIVMYAPQDFYRARLCETSGATEVQRKDDASSAPQTVEESTSAAAPSTTGATGTGYESAAAAIRRHDYRAVYSACLEPAKTGDSRCQNTMGILYANGHVGTRSNADLKIAADWFERAAQQNLAAAQYNLGVMQERGLGMPRDLNAAKASYERAASQGHANAKKALNRMGTAQTESTGQGVGATSPGASVAVTPAEAAPKGSPDVLGIKLGFSTIDEVRATLNKVTPALDLNEIRLQLVGMSSSMQRRLDVANGAYIYAIVGITHSYEATYHTTQHCSGITIQKGNCEEIFVSFSAPPHKPIAISVRRSIIFASEPPVDTVTRSLVEKYGVPGFRGRYGALIWAYSKDGNPLPLRTGHPCTSQMFATEKSEFTYNQAQSRAAIQAGCAALVFASFGVANNLVKSVAVLAINHAAINTSATQTLAFISEYVKDVERQERDNAAKNSAPKF